MMDKEARQRLRRSLQKRGFDTTKSYKNGVVAPRCSQCVALVINGTACHETGCPNARRADRGRRTE